MAEANIFDEIYRNYLEQVARIDLSKVADRLGVQVVAGGVLIPFYGMPHRVSAQGITDEQGCRPNHAVSVILCKYLLMCPETEPADADWISYKDFKDAAPFVGGFVNNVEKPLSLMFSGRLAELQQVCPRMNGRVAEIGVACDQVILFEALPKIPLLMLFNDRDEDFPARCHLLFERRAQSYLDMECLAMTGWAIPELVQRFTPEGPDRHNAALQSRIA